MAWIRETIEINPSFNPAQREAVASEVIDFIVERSKAGKDKNNKPFPGYSDEYKASKEFKIAGKSPGKVNLTLSNQMLNSVKLLRHERGKIIIGHDRNDKFVNAKAEGNIKGTYGQSSPIPGKQRDYLGIDSKNLKKIEKRFDLENVRTTRERLENITRLRATQEFGNDN